MFEAQDFSCFLWLLRLGLRLFFHVFECKNEAMSSIMKITTFTMVHLSTIVMVLFMSSVTKNTTSPTMARAIAVINHIVRGCFCFVVVSFVSSLYLFCFFCSTNQIITRTTITRPAILSTKLRPSTLQLVGDGLGYIGLFSHVL